MAAGEAAEEEAAVPATGTEVPADNTAADAEAPASAAAVEDAEATALEEGDGKQQEAEEAAA